MIRRLVMVGPALARALEHCTAGYPDEVCGILAGVDGDDASRQIREAHPLANVAPPHERARRFKIDPREHLLLERALEQRGLSVLGFYHSHPDAPAIPSPTDAAEAWPFYSYLIVSVRHAAADEIRSWVYDDNTRSFAEQPFSRLKN